MQLCIHMAGYEIAHHRDPSTRLRLCRSGLLLALPGMDPLLMTMVAVLLALSGFGLMVILGVAVVEALRLPRDLPDELRFVAPVPEVDDRPPAERAAQHQVLAAAGAAVHQVHVDAWAVVMAAEGHDDSDLHAASRQARALAEEAAQAWQAQDVAACERCRSTCAALRSRIERLVADRPDPRRRRILILLALLLIMILWLVLVARMQGG